jgi:hypothetical protein
MMFTTPPGRVPLAAAAAALLRLPTRATARVQAGAHAGRARGALLGGAGQRRCGCACRKSRARARVVETTPQGYALTLHVSSSGKTGTLALDCTSGHSFGVSTRFGIHKGRFTAIRTIGRRWLLRFVGFFDHPGHVRGAGSVRPGTCGGGIGSSFAEGRAGLDRMLSCPASSPESPLTAGVPYLFAGIVPSAALGTRLRLEYTDPNSLRGQPVVVHLRTDSSGRFSNTHAFPASGGDGVYGASATPRWPDDPLAPRTPCRMEVQG